MTTYKIKLERNTVKTEVTTIEIEADNEADARILAKYHEISEWGWAGDGPAKTHDRVIRSIEVDHGVDKEAAMIDARILLMAEQAHRDDGNHATAGLLREAACTINGLRTALKLARAQLAVERDALIQTHGIDGVIPADDELGLAGVADLDAVLAQIDEALK